MSLGCRQLWSTVCETRTCPVVADISLNLSDPFVVLIEELSQPAPEVPVVKTVSLNFENILDIHPVLATIIGCLEDD